MTIGSLGVDARSQLPIREMQAACKSIRNSSPSLGWELNFEDVREIPDRHVEVIIGGVPHFSVI